LVRKEILLIFLDDFQMSDVRRRMDSSDGGKRAKGSPTVFNKENNLSFPPMSLIGKRDYGSCK
jgi:hypothetical protein